ncbi:MAG: DUF1707 domain-containing protein [Streptosporangiaceae bacterium]|jgi:hypothetical protein
MPAQYSPPWARGSASRRANDNADLRVGDAERAEAADRLSRHYGDGRLDQDELGKRLDQAMSAKTQADLNGLFTDLPEAEPAHSGAARPHRPPLPRILFLAFVAVIAVGVGHAMAHFAVPWLLIAFLAFLAVRYGPWHRRRC